MALLFDSAVQDILGIVLALLLVTVAHFKIAFNYWKKRKMPQVRQPTIPWGTLPNCAPLKVYLGQHFKEEYDAAKAKKHPHIGYFMCSLAKYIPIDLEYIKNILQRDFNYFTERGFYYNEKDDPLSANLFALGGEKWRILRTKLSPAFTSGKLKTIFGGLLQCSNQMQEAMEKICGKNHCVNVKDISECFVIDVIGSCAFGLECNSFKNPEAEFRKKGKKIFYFSYMRIVKIILAFSYQNLARRLGVTLFDKDLNDFFTKVVEDSIKYRASGNIVRKDFLQLLLDLRNNNEEPDQSKPNFSVKDLTAQVFVFFAAGFESSSITLAFCLYELAINPDIQTKLRGEINRILGDYDGEVTYDAVMDMKYLNQVVEETLRKYPPVSYITRVAVKDYQIPGTEIHLEKGTEAVISILGIHRDPDYYPDPEKFDPERFSEENRQQRLPFMYMPFGEGPRICIGLRFGLMQVKTGLAVLLRDYKFSPNSKTEIPLQMEPYSFTLTPKNGVFLDVEKICH